MGDYSGYGGQGGDDASGDVVGEDEIMGLVRQVIQAQRGGNQRAMPPQLTSKQQRVAKLRAYLGVGELTFNSTTGVTGGGPLVIEPQRAFRPERLVISRRDGSATTNGISVRVDNIFIGDMPQSPSQEKPAPTEMFAPDATYSGIDFDVCDKGQKIQINISAASAPTGTEFVKVTLGFYGDMLR